ncbi:MAG: methylenetetrahydrofolate--tRNA-(uracil(54)-C(5))-methyltransferase (FADH(2)-oxidizing) TrmFO [Bdellovibrionales bacterium]|nr:methylenetetrahydrofolate--tRNA-(uracil(54)-C(5))-methyltransferase (FADH(2)-oxidizing) TrmFO [Bdellovibrionales bacterium]
MSRLNPQISIVGGGLAGSECAYQLAEMGHYVRLYEMRGTGTTTPAHKTDRLAELVCSNSLGSTTDYSAPGQLKWEAEQLGSLILRAARNAAVPAGMALGVDRDVFAAEITETLEKHPRIEIVREVVRSLDEIPRPAVIASGPLTDSALAESLRQHFDGEFMYFFDAIAPIIDADSINKFVAYKADRWGKGNRDYYNCPLNKEQYENLINEIKNARKIEPKEFEKDTPYFSGCMPVEAIVERGDQTLRFGPMSAKGLRNPMTNQPAYAVVQLRQDNKEGTAFNMVGFQTKMAYGEQVRVFRMIPGLENAEFLKLGSIHRNLYIQTPKKLTPELSSQKDDWLFFAGQITGVEGYFDSTCMGLLVAHFLNDKLNGRQISKPPRESALGSLLNGITEDNEYFQPTNINFALFPRPEGLTGKKKREQKDLKRKLQLDRAKSALVEWMRAKGLPLKIAWPPPAEVGAAEPEPDKLTETLHT